jgi:hypothetical protein
MKLRNRIIWRFNFGLTNFVTGVFRPVRRTGSFKLLPILGGCHRNPNQFAAGPTAFIREPSTVRHPRLTTNSSVGGRSARVAASPSFGMRGSPVFPCEFPSILRSLQYIRPGR